MHNRHIIHIYVYTDIPELNHIQLITRLPTWLFTFIHLLLTVMMYIDRVALNRTTIDNNT